MAYSPGQLARVVYFGGGGVSPGGAGSTSAIEVWNIKTYYPTAGGVGGTSGAAAFNGLVGIIGALRATLYLPKGNYLIDANVVVPENIRVWLAPGARIQQQPGFTITFNGGFDAPLETVFDQVNFVSFGTSRKIPYVYPQWWGAKVDAANDDNPAIWYAVLAAASGSSYRSVFMTSGTWRGATGLGAFNVFARPRTGITMLGQDGTIWKAANGLNAVSDFQFMRHVVADEGLASIQDFTVRHITFDHNGVNNLVPVGSPTRSNVAVGIEVGSNITVEENAFLNNAGLQTLSFGNNTDPQKVQQVQILGNLFQEMGNSVVGNVNSTDHSTIYCQALVATIQGNQFKNTVNGTKNTAIENHSSDAAVVGNSIVGYSIGFNVVATVTPHQRVVYAGNTGKELVQAFVFWAQNSKVMRDIRVGENVMEQRSTADVISQAFIDLSAGNTTGIENVSLENNTFRSTQTPNANTSPCVSIGIIRDLRIINNRIKGFLGRAVEQVTIDTRMRLTIAENEIIDCGKTTTAGNQQGIALLGLVSILLLRISRNRISNVGEAGAGTVLANAGAATFSTSQAGFINNGDVIVVGGTKYTISAFNGTTGATVTPANTFAATAFEKFIAYMTSGIVFNSPVVQGVIEDNDVEGIATPAQEVQCTAASTNCIIRHRGTGTPIALAVVAAPGSQWVNKSGGAATTTYVKETLNTSGGWVAK